MWRTEYQSWKARQKLDYLVKVNNKSIKNPLAEHGRALDTMERCNFRLWAQKEKDTIPKA